MFAPYEAQPPPPPDQSWRSVVGSGEALPLSEEMLAYQAQHPELSFRQCYEATTPAAAPAAQAPPAGRAENWRQAMHNAPPHHAAAMQYMLERPGVSYLAAVDHVTRQASGKG